MSQNVLIALGSNATLFDRNPKEIIQSAIGQLSERLEKLCESSIIYRTPCFPVGAGPDYANAVIRVVTDHSPEEILLILHEIEADFGRVRDVRWGMRTLDLDLIAVGDRVLPDGEVVQAWIDLPLADQMREAPDRLVLPHPRLQDRAFVLVPMADVAPDWVHPLLNRSVREMLGQLPGSDIDAVIPYE